MEYSYAHEHTFGTAPGSNNALRAFNYAAHRVNPMPQMTALTTYSGTTVVSNYVNINYIKWSLGSIVLFKLVILPGWDMVKEIGKILKHFGKVMWSGEGKIISVSRTTVYRGPDRQTF